ncbi:MAG: WYL domain-containing protein [Proteobacteria bacterium]|nr:WYL domain-containing protein [Pseudomonadota bacterium]
MSDRFAKLDRLLGLIQALAETTDGLTLDEMADHLAMGRRTAERLRDLIAMHFDLDFKPDGRRKRFLIRDSLKRHYVRPAPAELAALQAEIEGHRAGGNEPRAVLLAGLLSKIKGAFDDHEKRRIDPDLDALARIQRNLVAAGPIVRIAPETMTIVQSAILAGCCIEFHYRRETSNDPQWRRVIPYGLVHGPVTYLLGKIPGDGREPVYYRLDRIVDPKLSDKLGCVPDDWDIDDWLARSFGVWREDELQDIVLRVHPAAAERAQNWRFHRSQQTEALADGGLRISFSAGGMRELADHLFSWGGDLVVESPPILIETLRTRIEAAQKMVAPTVKE